MKFCIALLTATAVSAGRPELSIQVRDGNFGSLDGLDPSINWSTSTTTGDFDLEAGVDIAARPTSDIASLPRSVWGKASTSTGGWALSARGEVQRDSMSTAAIEATADSEKDDLSLKFLATAGDDFSLDTVSATKGINSNGARITINPSLDVASKDVDVTVTYDAGKTNVEINASKEEQTVKVSQQVDDANRVAPSFAVRSGKLAVEWERDLGDDNSLTTTLRPNESIEMEWKDSAWTANINMPVEDNKIAGANVSVKREVNF